MVQEVSLDVIGEARVNEPSALLASIK